MIRNDRQEAGARAAGGAPDREARAGRSARLRAAASAGPDPATVDDQAAGWEEVNDKDNGKRGKKGRPMPTGRAKDRKLLEGYSPPPRPPKPKPDRDQDQEE